MSVSSTNSRSNKSSVERMFVPSDRFAAPQATGLGDEAGETVDAAIEALAGEDARSRSRPC
jgi:hypothetical protein